MTNKLLESALVYASWGWAIHPLRHGDKRPLVKDWPNMATTDAESIRLWWGRWPNANIGLACGPSGLLVVDLDIKAGADGLKAWADLQAQHSIPDQPTPASRTPSGGRHLLYSVNGAGLGNSAGKLAPGIDTRADGGYIVLPPSTLAEGGRWEWDSNARPEKYQPLPLPSIIERLLTDTGNGSRPAPSPSSAGAYARAALEGELGKLIMAKELTRNDTLNKCAFSLGQLVGGGLLDRSEVEGKLEATARAIGLGESETLATIKSGLDDGEKHPRQVPDRARSITATIEPPAPDIGLTERKGLPPAGGPDLDPYDLSDLGNSERLKARHGDDLYYCDPWGTWLTWDGRRWREDDTRAVERRANDTVRAILASAHNEPDKDRRAALARWAAKSQSGHRRREMVNGARALLPVLPGDLDANPWLLTVKSGTIDLRTCELQPHRKQDLITKLAPVDYEPTAGSPNWESFLDRIMAGNQDLIDFLRRAVGYSLTGDTREQCFFILYGNGANGKSTFLEALSNLLDEYGRKTPIKTVLVKRSDGVPEDIARLKGARLVTTVEAEEGQRLAESLVKELVGGDTIAARHLYGKTFEFQPQFKLWLATNHKPSIRGTDLAIWRRIRLIPFTVTIPPEEQDKTLGHKLRAELPGILDWALRGCLEWQAQGLGTPEEVKEATASYRAEMDRLAGWLADCCHIDTTAQARSADLYESYKTWCDNNGERAMSGTLLGRRLGERGFDKYRDGKGIKYIGIGLLSTRKGDPLPV